MDEPFTGLDPVNLALLREAFVELRDEGRTIVFSTHQMEAAEALCESLAIVDHGRVVAGGTLAEVKRASRARTVRLGVAGETMPDWLASVCPASRPSGPGAGFAEIELDAGRRARGVLAGGARARRAGDPLRGRRAVARGGLHRARRPPGRRRRGDPRHDVPAIADADADAPGRRGRRLMARRDPLLPNAGIVARREYRDRVRSPLFLASTVLLMVLALASRWRPIAIRYLDRQTRRPASRSSPRTTSLPRGRRRHRQPAEHPAARRGPATWQTPFVDRARADAADAAGAARERRRWTAS